MGCTCTAASSLLLLPAGKGLLAQPDDAQLDPAVLLDAGDLALDGRTQAQGNGDELADEAVAGIDAVEPWLLRQRNIVLRPFRQFLRPRLPA